MVWLLLLVLYVWITTYGGSSSSPSQPVKVRSVVETVKTTEDKRIDSAYSQPFSV